MPFYTGGVNLNDFYISDDDVVDQYLSGKLWSWGANAYGMLGDNTGTSRSSPVQTITGGTNWKQVSCGFYSSAAVKTDGTLWLWGSNYDGTIGDDTTTSRYSPVQTITGGTNWKQVSLGFDIYFHTAAVKTDGTLWTWGANAFGGLGDGTGAGRSSPVQTITGGNNWKQVSCGKDFTAAVKTDGTLWTWGRNTYGALGDNTTANKNSPEQVMTGGNNWNQVSCGYFHTAAIKTDGTLWAWGFNTSGQLGGNDTVRRSSPVQTIAGGTNWKQVACNRNLTVAVKTDGTLWTWGSNSYGMLGDNTTTNRSSPVQTIVGGNNWKQVACGYRHTAAVKTDGTLWTWGRNSYGPLGDNTTTDRSSPVQTVTGGTNWRQVACGSGSSAYSFTAAVQNDG